MTAPVYEFLLQTAPFSYLPKNELLNLANQVRSQAYDKYKILSIQNKSEIEDVFIIQSGLLELYYEKEGKKLLSSFLKRGQSCGAIGLLMNDGVSVRTVMAAGKADLFLVPRDLFLKLCRQYPEFSDYYIKIYRKLADDQSYASIVSSGQARRFLSRIVPFAFLSETERERVASKLSVVRYPRKTVVFTQDRSKVEYLHILQKGVAYRYYEDQGEKKLRGMLGEGDIHGGISMLINNGISVRTLEVEDESYFYLLSEELFADLCDRYEEFTEFFTDTFGKRMLDKTYSSIITKTDRPDDQSNQFFNQTVESLCNSALVSCNADLTICQAAIVMTQKRCSSIFIKGSHGDCIGVVTDNDLRSKVIAKGYDIEAPVRDIMSSPLHTIGARSFVFEALLEMMRKNVKHLAVTDVHGRVVDAITNRDLVTAQGRSPLFLIREIGDAPTIAEIINKHSQLAGQIKNLINSGAKARNVTRMITTISDAILNKLIGFAIDELGEPPVKFVFMILGSEGRKEQTLKTDQDNAIIYGDVPETSEAQVKRYFLAFSEKVCTWLDQAGYTFCKGGIMAQNPKWCQSLSAWKQNFSNWIYHAEAENLLQASIFFDFRGAYGETELIDQLRQFLFESLSGWAGFFRHLTENAIYFKPPLGFFRNFIVESEGEHRDSFDIKSAMQPIVDFARIYALKYQLDETNTQERLYQLYLKEILTPQEYNELDKAYSFMMQLRFIRQFTVVLEQNGQPDNYINPKKLSRIEQTMLKEIFKRIANFQTKLEVEFIGII
ncbi:DUF294 nucleotidyltransferase-like domain-containing protein [Desulfococcaceae bacterium HSG9]|nr:DUF294 nucleotidyltransferase-like domain-containing protein [Desulfococcaceae bacterium HSG9]